MTFSLTDLFIQSSFVNYCQWCYVVATTPPGHLRLRALNCIQGLLGAGDTALIRTPTAFESLFAGLLSLVALSSTNPIYFPDSDGMNIIQSCIKVLRSGICAALDPKALMERYGPTYSKGDESTVCDLIAFGSLAKCIESSMGPSRAWLIQYACNVRFSVFYLLQVLNRVLRMDMCHYTKSGFRLRGRRRCILRS